jgi:hypothetical protein
VVGFQRFLPSEFGPDVDCIRAVEPAACFFGLKAGIRRSIEAEGIPYTYVVSNGFAGSFLRNFGQDGATAPPRDKVAIVGDGNPKGIRIKVNHLLPQMTFLICTHACALVFS